MGFISKVHFSHKNTPAPINPQDFLNRFLKFSPFSAQNATHIIRYSSLSLSLTHCPCHRKNCIRITDPEMQSMTTIRTSGQCRFVPASLQFHFSAQFIANPSSEPQLTGSASAAPYQFKWLTRNSNPVPMQIQWNWFAKTTLTKNRVPQNNAQNHHPPLLSIQFNSPHFLSSTAILPLIERITETRNIRNENNPEMQFLHNLDAIANARTSTPRNVSKSNEWMAFLCWLRTLLL